MMENDKALEKRESREKALSLERRKILSLPPDKALNAVLDYPFPVTLVQSMAEEDLYLLVHTIGPDDALPVLGLASNEQWEYVLDMDVWTRDRIDSHAVTEWLDRLLQADPDRFTHWIVHEKQDLFEHYLHSNVELLMREHDQDPSEFGDGFSTEDDVNYVRLRPYPSLMENAVQKEEQRDFFLSNLLKRLSTYDYPLYNELLLRSSAVIPAESVEELLRLRNVRLAEKGFLPFEEAVGVYQPLKVDELLKRNRKTQGTGGRPVESYPLVVAPVEPLADADLFARTLAQLQDEATLMRLQAEFAGLCNQVIAADQKRIREKVTLAQVVSKASGYISIGLEKVAEETQADDPFLYANLLQSFLLGDIFRVGFGSALELKWKADRWRRASWFAAAGLPLSFWGEKWLGVLGGLLIKKPLYFDNYASGVLYRDFAALDDIRSTARTLQQIMAVDDLLSQMGISAARLESGTLLTCHNLLLTMWADHRQGLQTPHDTPIALALDDFKEFFDQLWEAGPSPRRIKDSLREDFLAWLAARSKLSPYDISQRLGPFLDELFSAVETELGAVDRRNLDPRFIQLFLVRS